MKPIKKLGKDYQTEVVEQIKINNIFDVYGLNVHKSDNDYWCIRFMYTFSDSQLRKYLQIDQQCYKERLSGYSVFSEGDTTFFHKEEDAIAVMDWIESILLMKKCKGEL